MRGESGNWVEYGPLVKERILQEAEGPLLDKKREHYYFDSVKDDSGHEINPQKKRADFLKDLIALANAARQRNEHAYLCLGIAEYDEWTLHGVEGRHPVTNPRPAWEEVESHPELMNRWAEGIARVYLGFAEQYIEPGLPDVHYETGWIEDHLIGLLVIGPGSSPAVGFYLTESEQKRRKLEEMSLEPGFSWRRLGALSDRIAPHQRDWMLKAHDRFPYVPLEGWKSYFEHLLTQYEYHPEAPSQIARYQPLRARSDSEEIKTVAEFLDRFAHSNELPRVLLLTGLPGGGKTTVLERLTWDLASEAYAAMMATHNRRYVPGQDRALDFPKDVPIPVLVNLCGFEVSKQCTPEDLFCRAMTSCGGSILRLDQHESPANILCDRDFRFVLMLDGLDEIPRRRHSLWARTLRSLHSFVERYPATRFIVSCRSNSTEDVGPQWRGLPRLHIEPLTEAQVREYLGGTAWQGLLAREDILDITGRLLRNPRWISALCEADATHLSLGVVLDHAVQGFVHLEFEKRESQQSERSRLRSKAGEFAVWLLSEGLRAIGEDKAREQLGARNFDFLYRAGILVFDQQLCRFVDPVVHDYFAAQQLLSCHHNRRQRRLVSLSQVANDSPHYWRRAIHVAANIWQDDLTEGPFAAFLPVLDAEGRLQAFTERQYEPLSNVAYIRESLEEYLAQADVDLALVELVLCDENPALVREAVKCVAAAGYLSARDTLAAVGERSDEPELQHLVASALIQLGDERGEHIMDQMESDEEPTAPTKRQHGQGVSPGDLSSKTLDRLGG